MKHLIFIILLTASINGISQDFPFREYDLEKLAENIFPIQDLDIDYSQLYENLAQILSNPIDLNTADEDQFRLLYLLSETQIANLLAYREEQGSFISVYELQSISGFDPVTLDLLVPFVTIRSHYPQAKSLWQRIMNEKNNYLLLRTSRTMESQSGYKHDNGLPAAYAGSPERIYSRFRVARASDFSIGFTLEKDAGETLAWSPSKKQLGFDYNSFHVQALRKGKVQNLILGDFQAQFGQGLVLGGGFGIGKGAETITTVRRNNAGFLPYTSINETGFFRGLAGSVDLAKGLSLHVLAARNWRDGTANTDSTGMSLSAISSSGLHRTSTEMTNRKVVLESNYGAVLNYKKSDFEIGAIVHHTDFGIPISRNPTAYNQFYFKGTDNTNAGIFMNYNIKNVSLFSEAAQTAGHGKAIVAGTLASLSPSFDVALLFRSYERNYQSFYGNALSENSTVQNESGYYVGWKYRFNKQHTVTGYTDIFQFPWLRYRGYAPSNGHEWLARYAYQPNKEALIYVQVREESKIRNHAGDGNLYHTENGLKRNLWINADYALNQRLSFKSRAQFSSYTFNSSFTNGFALIQDINLRAGKFTLSGRYALFDTDDYDNRQYVYERDVWLAFTFPFYNGTGIRNYVLVQYALHKKVDLWLRWSRTKYVDREWIGSGNERIDADHMNELRIQARIRF